MKLKKTPTRDRFDAFAFLRRRFTYEFLFSFYFGVLITSAEETRDFSWSRSLRLLISALLRPNSEKPGDDPHLQRLIAFIFGWLLVAFVFALLHLSARVSFVRVPFLIAGGFVALGGLPAVLLYAGFGNRVLLTAMMVLGASYTILYVCFSSLVSEELSLLLLLGYFIFSSWVAWRSWTTFPLGVYLLWPGWDFLLITYSFLKTVYPLLGFILSVAWATYVRETAQKSSSLKMFE